MKNEIEIQTDLIMQMLRARAEDGQIHISDDGVQTFIRDAIVRILGRFQEG